jgi:uncharacterized membrane protein
MEAVSMMFLWLPLLFVVPLLILWTERPGVVGSGSVASAPATLDHAREIVRLRLARGEITAAEYNDVISTLR